MTRSGKIILFLLAGAGILVALLAALVFLGPRLVNTKAFRDLALGELERRTGLHLSYARAEVTFFPRPRVVIRGVSIDVPGLAAGTVATLQVDPELLPLLRGQFRNGAMLLEDPDMRVRIPPRSKPEKPFSVEEFEGNLSSLLATLRRRAPATVVTVRNGRLELSDGDRPIVSLRELNARVGFPPERMTLQLRCASPYWESLSIESSLRPEGLRGETRVETAGFRVRDFVDRLAPGAVPWLGKTVVSLRGTIETDRFRTLQARATLTGSTITIPGIDLTLVDVGGEASLSGGILTGRGLSARLGNSRVREGTLRMGIGGGDPPFHAELPVDADLGELPPLLRRLVPDERFREEIDRIHGARGTASGRLTLGERLSSIRPTVALTSVNLDGKYDRIPFPITIRGGEVSYDGASFAVKDLRGSLGGSTVSGLTGRVDLGKTPAISIRGGTARIALEEVYPWIASLDGIRETVTPVRSVRGVAGIATLSCDGPLREPGEWRFEAGGSVENLEVDTSLLPGPVTIPRGRFRIRPEELSFTDVEASLLDTTCQGGVQLRGYTKGIDQVAASLHGDVGARGGEVGVRTPRGPASVRSQGALHRDRLDDLLGKGRRRRRGCDACVAGGAGHLALPPEDPGDAVGRPARDTGRGVGRENGLPPRPGDSESEVRRHAVAFDGREGRADPGADRPTDPRERWKGSWTARTPRNPRPAGRWRRTISPSRGSRWLPSRSGIFPFRRKGGRSAWHRPISCGTTSRSR